MHFQDIQKNARVHCVLIIYNINEYGIFVYLLNILMGKNIINFKCFDMGTCTNILKVLLSCSRKRH